MTTETVEQPTAPTEEVQIQDANSATDSEGNDSAPELEEGDDAALQQSHNQVEGFLLPFCGHLLWSVLRK